MILIRYTGAAGQYLRLWSPDCEGVLYSEGYTRRGHVATFVTPPDRLVVMTGEGKLGPECLTTWNTGYGRSGTVHRKHCKAWRGGQISPGLLIL